MAERNKDKKCEYEDLLKPVKLNYKLAMLNVIDVNWKADIRSFISLFLLLLLNFGSIFFLYQNAGDIENIQDVAESAGVLGSSSALLAKILVSILKRKEIISFSDDTMQQYSKSINEHPEITNVYARHFSFITKLFSGLVLILCVQYILYTITSVFGDEPRLPLLLEFPYFPTDGWPFFHIFYSIQIAMMWVGCNLSVGIELLSFFYIQFVCCRIAILTHMVEHWNKNIKCSRNDSDARKNNILLEQIVEYHSSIKQNMNAIRRIFSPMLMATLLTNSIVICMCLIIIFVNPMLKMVSHIVVALSQTFMYCYIGNMLLKQNDNLVEKIMLVDFHYLKVSERKAYMNVVQNACNPIKLQSYFLTVDMTLFFKVVKFAYSVFSLLKTRM